MEYPRIWRSVTAKLKPRPAWRHIPAGYPTIRLGEPYRGNLYKLIAGVMVVPGGNVEAVG